MACALSVGERAGWRAVVLENERLRLVVLPEKGADIYELVDLESGVDVLFKAPWGLQRRGAEPREGSAGAPFLENYEGGWQELFPSGRRPVHLPGQARALARRGGHETLDRELPHRHRARARSRVQRAVPEPAPHAVAGHTRGGRGRRRSRSKSGSTTTRTSQPSSSGDITASSDLPSSRKAAASSLPPGRSARLRKAGRRRRGCDRASARHGR